MANESVVSLEAFREILTASHVAFEGPQLAVLVLPVPFEILSMEKSAATLRTKVLPSSMDVAAVVSEWRISKDGCLRRDDHVDLPQCCGVSAAGTAFRAHVITNSRHDFSFRTTTVAQRGEIRHALLRRHGWMDP